MLGHWRGTYTEHNKNLNVTTNLDTIPFEFYIDSYENDEFQGFAEDKIFHLTDKFAIQGRIQGRNVYFTKYKAVGQGTGNDITTKEVDKDGPIILYIGKLSDDKEEMTGEWKFKLKFIYLFGFIPFPYRRSKGTWTLKYVADV